MAKLVDIFHNFAKRSIDLYTCLSHLVVNTVGLAYKNTPVNVVCRGSLAERTVTLVGEAQSFCNVL